MNYNDKLKLAKEALDSGSYDKETIEYIFPELKESEDEKIKEELKAHVGLLCDGLFPQKKDWIAWLEKQGEQKPDDNVERKGMNITEEKMTPFQKKVFCIIDTTIEEEQGLKQVCDELLALAYNEIEQKPAWSEEDEETLKIIDRDLQEFYSRRKAQAGSPLFESQMQNIRWLKSLKDRVQPQQEWSEADKRKINRIYSILRQAADTHAFSTSCRLIGDKECIELQNLLKSLRPQNTWKPSDEQMHYLSWIANIKLGDSVVEQEVSKHLNELYTDLKKLK